MYFIDCFIVILDADDFEPAAPSVRASDKWEGEDVGEDVKVRYPSRRFYCCEIPMNHF